MPKRTGSERPRSIVVVPAFVYLWLMIAVAITALGLIGPVRWATGRPDLRIVADAIWPLLMVAGAVLLASFLLTRWVLRKVILSRSRVVRMSIPVFVTLLAVASAWAWLAALDSPGVTGGPDGDVSVSSRAEATT